MTTENNYTPQSHANEKNVVVVWSPGTLMFMEIFLGEGKQIFDLGSDWREFETEHSQTWCPQTNQTPGVVEIETKSQEDKVRWFHVTAQDQHWSGKTLEFKELGYNYPDMGQEIILWWPDKTDVYKCFGHHIKEVDSKDYQPPKFLPMPSLDSVGDLDFDVWEWSIFLKERWWDEEAPVMSADMDYSPRAQATEIRQKDCPQNRFFLYDCLLSNQRAEILVDSIGMPVFNEEQYARWMDQFMNGGTNSDKFLNKTETQSEEANLGLADDHLGQDYARELFNLSRSEDKSLVTEVERAWCGDVSQYIVFLENEVRINRPATEDEE